MAEILERASANSGSFYHFFDSKEALLLAVLDSYLEGLEPIIVRPAFAAERDPIDRIFAILQGYRLRLIDTGCCYGCPLGRLALEIEAENLPAHSRISANFNGWIGAVRTCLEDARDRFPPGLDLDALATFVLTTMEGGVLQARSARLLKPFDQSVAQLRHYFECLTVNTLKKSPNKGKKHEKAILTSRGGNVPVRPIAQPRHRNQAPIARKGAQVRGDRTRPSQ
jgi:TetR/AcrR family transcriptional repressor of nem operon